MLLVKDNARNSGSPVAVCVSTIVHTLTTENHYFKNGLVVSKGKPFKTIVLKFFDDMLID